MATEIVVCVIAAFSSLLVALASLATAVFTHRASSRTTQELEEIRYRFDTARENASRKHQDLKAWLAKSQKALKAAQLFKDDLQVVLSSVSSSLEAKTAAATISSSRKRLFAAYENVYADLPKAEREILHQAKNLALKVEEQVVEFLDGKQFASELSSDQRKTLVDLRSELTLLQSVLLDGRIEKLMNSAFS